MNYPKGETFFKISLFLSLILLIYGIISAASTPAQRFEASIYISTPLIFWISILITMTVCVCYIFFIQNPKNNYFSIYCLIALFLCYFLVSSLFMIRGYYMWGNNLDQGDHIGWINQLMNDGHSPYNLIYPALHILSTFTIELSDIDIVTLSKAFPVFLIVLNFIFLYIFVKNVLKTKKEQILFLLIGCTFTIYGLSINFISNHTFNLLVPFILYLIIKAYLTNNKIWLILLIIYLFALPIMHLVVTLFIGIILFSFWCISKFKKIHDNQILNLIQPHHIPIIILVVWSVIWIASFTVFGIHIQRVYNIISAEEETTQLSYYVQDINFAQNLGYNIYETVLKRLGGKFIIIFFGLLSIPIIFKKFIGSTEEYFTLMTVNIANIILIITALILFFFNFSFTPLRLLVYICLLASLLTAWLMNYYLERSNSQIFFKRLLCCMLIIGLFIVGLLNFYPSPYTLEVSYHSPLEEVRGMKYFFAYKEVNIPSYGLFIYLGNYAHLLLLNEEQEKQNISPSTKINKPPYHFGYDKSKNYQSDINSEGYLLITTKDKSVYKDYFPDVANLRYSPIDFIRLNFDDSLEKIYSNRDFDIFIH